MRRLAESSVSEPSLDLVQTLRDRAIEWPGASAFTLLEEGEASLSFTYSQLDQRARRVAATLQALGVGEGQRALLLYPFGLDYIAAFFGALYARVIAVPVYPPDPSRLDRTLPRLQAIARDARAQVILTTGFIHGMFESLSEAAPELGDLLGLDVAVDVRDPQHVDHAVPGGPADGRGAETVRRRGALELLAERLRRELGFQGLIRVVEVDRTPGEVCSAPTRPTRSSLRALPSTTSWRTSASRYSVFPEGAVSSTPRSREIRPWKRTTRSGSSSIPRGHLKHSATSSTTPWGTARSRSPGGRKGFTSPAGFLPRGKSPSTGRMLRTRCWAPP